MQYRGYTLKSHPYGDGESYFTVRAADGANMGATESLAKAKRVVDLLMGESRPLPDVSVHEQIHAKAKAAGF